MDIDGIYLEGNLRHIFLEFLYIEFWIDCEGRREEGHKDEENESDSLLSIISSMFIADPRTRYDEYESIPEIRRMVEKSSWDLEGHLTSFCETVKDIHSSKCYTESDEW